MTYDPILYALVHTGTPGDVDFYRAACRGAARVLELGCGYGRVLAELVAAGHDVTGLDLHPGLLALARDALASRPPAERRRGHLVRGDMTCPPLRGPYDRVLIPHSGLYCLRDDQQVARCLRRCHALLRPGGRLVLDAYAADAFHAECEPEDVPEDHLEAVALIAVEGQVYDVYERSRWDKARQTMVATYVHVPQGQADGAPIEASIPQRYLLRPQLEAQLRAAGFVIERVAGDFEGAPYGPHSELIALTARRPAAPRG